MSSEKFFKNNTALITLIAACLVVLISLSVRQVFGMFFVEGGGSVISNFYKNNMLHQLQVCICPIILGDGKSSFVIKAPMKIEDIEFNEISYHSMGEDILCNLTLIPRKSCVGFTKRNRS